MNKTVIYTYITQIECELNDVLSCNPYADLIMHEIITEAFMITHDIDDNSSHFTDKELAKKAVRMSINSFYDAKNIVNIIDKFSNPKGRIFYGLKGRSVGSTKSLLNSIDILKKNVRDERDALISAVDKVISPNKSKFSTTITWKIIGAVFVSMIIILSVLCYAYSERYVKMNSRWVFDKWTERSIYILHSSDDDYQD